jgi:hypothetical protein
MATNFAIDNPLVKLQESGGTGGTPAPGTVTGGPGGSIANNTITSSNLASGAAAGNLTANSVPGTVIQNNSITSAQLAPGAAAGNLTANSVPGADIVNASITSAQLAPGAAAGNLTANSVPGADIVNNSITSAQLAPGAAVGNLTANSVPGADIVNASITNTQLAPGVVNTVKGTNSLGNVDDFALAPVLALTAGASPTLSISPTFVSNTARQSDIPFTVSATRPAFVSYIFDIAGIAQTINGLLDYKPSPLVQVTMNKTFLLFPVASGPYDASFTLNGFIPAGAIVNITITKDGVDQSGLASSFSEETLF